MSFYNALQSRLHRVSIRARLFSIVVAFAIPMFVLLYFTIENLNRNISLTVMERKGLEYERLLINLISEVANHRLTRMSMAIGEERSKEYREYSNNIDDLLEKIQGVDQRLRANFNLNNEKSKSGINKNLTVDELKQKWADIKKYNSDIHEIYNTMFQAIGDMITDVGGASGLILDPDLDSYYMMDIAINHLPRSIRRVSDITFILYPRLVYGGEIKEETRGEARVAERFLQESEFESVLFAMESAFNEDENFYGISKSLKPRMEPIISSYKEKMEKLISMLNTIASGGNIKLDDFLRNIYDARNFFVLMDYAALDELDAMLKVRINYLENQQWHILFWYALAQAIGLFLFVLLTTSVTTPINRLYRAIVGITEGNLKVDVPSQDFQDEIGKIARGVESFRLNALEKVRLEMALKAESDYLQSIMDSSMDGIIVMNDKGFILNFNSAAQNMFGYQAFEVMGKNISFLMPEKSPFHYSKYIGEYLNDINRGIAGINREIQGQRKNGSIFPIDMALSRLVHDDSHIFFVGLFKDITERKTMEAELIQHRDNLQKLVNMQTIDLIIEKERAERANIAKSEFLSNMSHELRTPMHAILNYASMGLKIINEPENKLNKYLGNIETAGTRLLGLLNSLLDIEKLEADKVEFNIKEADLSKVIDYAELELDSLIKAKNLHVVKLYQSSNYLAQFDEVRIIQILVNLLSNAIKFSSEHGKITIRLLDEYLPEDGNAKPALLCSIEDEGVGIPEAELESIFDKFTQSSKTKTMAGGTGLGLSISRKIIEKHGGKIWAENVKPKGAVFKFLLPRV